MKNYIRLTEEQASTVLSILKGSKDPLAAHVLAILGLDEETLKDFSMMMLDEFKDELEREKAWLKECEMNAHLAKAEIEHLEAVIKKAEGESK